MAALGLAATVVVAVVVLALALAADGVASEYGQALEAADALLEAGEAAAAAEAYQALDEDEGSWAYRRWANQALALATIHAYRPALLAAHRAAAINATLDLAFLSGFLHLMEGEAEEAVRLLSEATKIDASRGNGWLYLGNAHEALGQHALAKKAYAHAWRLLKSRKALRALGFAYRALGKPALEERLYATAVDEGVLVNARQRPDLLTPGLDATPWHANSEFAWMPALEAALPIMRAELDAVLAADPDRLAAPFHLVGTGGKFAHDRALYSASGKAWHQIVLFEPGEPGPGASFFPNTVAALSATIPHALSYGRVVISLIEPGVRIVPHCGPTNERLTVHCGLRVPSHLAVPPAIVVGGVERPWREDSCFVFDDSFEHEVSFPIPSDAEADALRAVLLFHIEHPGVAAARDAIAHVSEDEWLRRQFGAS
ncbi:beta-hydroxylase [Thecamonas trahens ATCC 50062]|uniref:Beta-hydroxylase n=1 Tax=Thecamonas trahens ATCC 50062 TaxID=461836 RepID=A0A0L0D7B6_THETB|nr:beta-hydroxylase [Thecamonas trahens ATCC 50062]KNC48244.1 beta-hydroxylase [Thecamonas trahens ATCC 50062]|eukprot:XP_013758813.1 beta-hydroxylase [Thecamonas trahens ATCC 50062]